MTTILVVEDESLIRMSIGDHLEKSGFTVLEARDADQALVPLAKHPEISIIFTDVDMPGSIDGIALAQAVRDRCRPSASTSHPDSGASTAMNYRTKRCLFPSGIMPMNRRIGF